LFDRQFSRSRMMLTVMYVVILALILFSSASITRSLFAQRIESRFSRVEIRLSERVGLPSPQPRPEDMRADFL